LSPLDIRFDFPTTSNPSSPCKGPFSSPLVSGFFFFHHRPGHCWGSQFLVVLPKCTNSSFSLPNRHRLLPSLFSYVTRMRLPVSYGLGLMTVCMVTLREMPRRSFPDVVESLAFFLVFRRRPFSPVIGGVSRDMLAPSE